MRSWSPSICRRTWLRLRAQGHVAGLVRRLGRSLGATRTLLRPAPHDPGLVSAHQHGGAVFGEDPTDAVVSPECECYEARGLFVADGAVMPTSGGTNSSLTAMANALRVADVVAAGG